MSLGGPEMPQHMILALDHHRQLIEEAKRRRQLQIACDASPARLVRWFWLRARAGDLLINLGRRLKPESTDAVWG